MTSESRPSYGLSVEGATMKIDGLSMSDRYILIGPASISSLRGVVKVEMLPDESSGLIYCKDSDIVSDIEERVGELFQQTYASRRKTEESLRAHKLGRGGLGRL